MKPQDADDFRSARTSKMADLFATAGRSDWSPGEQRDILHSLLDSPASALWNEEGGPTLGELLTGVEPPLAELKRIHVWAQSSTQPPGVASAVGCLAACAALVVHGELPEGVEGPALRAQAEAHRRPQWLDDRCRAVLERAAALLAAAADVAPADATQLVPPPSPDDEPRNAAPAVRGVGSAERPGTRVGRYKLLERLGEGGFGVVFLAEQEQPVRRQVALKVIKLGMDTRDVVARFEAERQALAMMDHPHVAKVLDAGATASGRPYFVMEWVRGRPITDYCDEHKLDTRERLALFAQVCRAVQHAHGKGIIHRDIKPSNVLVSRQEDGSALPKVIDFGIAKATEQRLTEKTLFTNMGHFLGTPQYMSPEQAGAGVGDVDTRSDVYSLGVLLYELLTGATPFDAKELRSKAFGEIQRVIREVEPPKPSTRLAALGGTSSAVAASRRSDTRKLSRQVRGELDWIAMKCLEKDRSRRYETANALALEVERHLAGEPVAAGPPSTAYRVRKFARRHWIGVSAAAATVFVLVGVAGLILYGLTRDARQREKYILDLKNEQIKTLEQKNEAVEAQSDSDGVTKFLQGMLGASEVDPEVGPIVALEKEMTVREALDEAARNLVLGELKDHPRVEAAVRQRLGLSYWKLGLLAPAEEHLRRSVELYKRQPKELQPDLSVTLSFLATVLADQRRFDDAESIHREALAMLRRNFGAADAKGSMTMVRLANTLAAAGKSSEAEKLYREALALEQKKHGDGHQHLVAPMDGIARILWDNGDLREAERLFREELAILTRVYGPEDSHTAITLMHLGALLMDRKERDEGERLARQALTIQRKLLPADSTVLAGSVNNLAKALALKGNLDESASLMREALGIFRKAHSGDDDSVAMAMGNLAVTLRAKGETREADELTRQAADMKQRIQAKEQAINRESAESAESVHKLASSYEDKKEWAEAERLHREGLALRRKSLGDNHPLVVKSLNSLGSSLTASGKFIEAQATLREALVIARKVSGDEDDLVLTTLGYMATLSTAAGDLAGRRLTDLEGMTAALRRREAQLKKEPLDVKLLTSRANILARLGRFDEAAAAYSQVVEAAGDSVAMPLLVDDACLRLYIGDVKGWRELCLLILEQMTPTDEVKGGSLAARACLMHDPPVGDMPQLKKLIEQAKGSEAAAQTNYQLAHAILEYRMGDYDEAVSWGERCYKGVTTASPPAVAATAGLFLAMAQQRSGRDAEAKQSYAKALILLKSYLNEPRRGDLGAAGEWMICQIARREAEAIFGPLPSNKAATKPTVARVARPMRTIEEWGRWVDPDGDCTADTKDRKLIVAVPGTVHDLNYEGGRINSPRVLRELSGDFRLRVKLTADFDPGEKPAESATIAYHGAGLFIWAAEDHYIRMERAQIFNSLRQRGYRNLMEYWRDGQADVETGYFRPRPFFRGGSCFMNLERRANLIRWSLSDDGVSWFDMAPLETKLPRTVQVGVSAGNTAAKPFSVTFEDLKIEPLQSEGDAATRPATRD